MESLQDLDCPVCLQMSKNAVQSQCCGHAFCEQCANLVKNKHNECPCCKQSPFTYKQGKLLRRMISGIKVQCSNLKCQQKIANADLQNHLNYCLFGQSNCRQCNQKFIRKELVQHTIEKHQEEAQKAIIDYHNNPVKSKISSASTSQSKIGGSNISTKSTVFDPSSELKNRAGRVSKLGTSGKYYCNGPLLLKCACCDGDCGPTNGENCLGCMQLDVKMRSLPTGYLVNASGGICKVNYKQSKVYCGILSSSFHGKCDESHPCRFCQNLSKTLRRYEMLLTQ